MHILVAEDDLVNQRLITALLRKLGCEVTVASDGQKAVDCAAAQEFDMIIMDIQMPQMDGFEATRLIREREQQAGKRVPIVACTAHALPGYRERCLAAGMDGFLTKPISRKALADAVDLYR